MACTLGGWQRWRLRLSSHLSKLTGVKERRGELAQRLRMDIVRPPRDSFGRRVRAAGGAQAAEMPDIMTKLRHPAIVLRRLALAIGIAHMLFLSLFAADVFTEDAPLARQLLGLAVHLLPSALLALGVAVAWRWPILGGAMLVGLAVLPFLALANTAWVNLMLGAPAALCGCLFWGAEFWWRRSGSS